MEKEEFATKYTEWKRIVEQLTQEGERKRMAERWKIKHPNVLDLFELTTKPIHAHI